VEIELPVIEGGMEIGKFNIDTGEIYPSETVLVDWNCCMDGDCCQRFHIPVTDFDIQRIETHGYELDQIISDEPSFVRMPKNRFGSLEKNYPIKRKPFTNGCTFLTPEGLCGIHEFRPFGCRIFPFQYRFEDESMVRVTVHESNYCHNLEGVNQEDAKNREFLEYLLDQLRLELNRREEYFSKYGDEI